MDSWFNIPAPALVKGESDVGAENSDRPIVIVAQADVKASAKTDCLKQTPRKMPRVARVARTVNRHRWVSRIY